MRGETWIPWAYLTITAGLLILALAAGFKLLAVPMVWLCLPWYLVTAPILAAVSPDHSQFWAILGVVLCMLANFEVLWLLSRPKAEQRSDA